MSTKHFLLSFARLVHNAFPLQSDVRLRIFLGISIVSAIRLNISDAGSIKNAAAAIAYDMMSYYTGNQTNESANVGLLPKPYYWWEAGAMWGAMVDYWYYTGDTSYNDVVAQALLSQVSSTNDFMMPAQHFDLGNDGQVFWALSAMAAAEHNFPNPSALPWIEVATNVFNDVVSRWNVTTCNGGLKWQIYSSNAGYDYKSTITNAGFFQLSARLARYTGNATYLAMNEKVWDWMTGVGLISDGYNVYDGTDDTINCSSVNRDQWTYNNAAMIYGTAILADLSDDTAPWLNRTLGFLQAAKSLFFSPYADATNVMFEAECEQPNTCNVDQFSFKAYLSRWLYSTAKLLPQLENTIIGIMVPTALAGAQSCSGGSNGRACGTRWWYGGWDGAVGLGQQMSALEAIHGLLLNTVDAPSVAPVSISAIAPPYRPRRRRLQ
ncbi:hydrolase 76 protein [Xylographa opegraphella]|nr:hydrolase 76 protein [Xylographa opegraphella]